MHGDDVTSRHYIRLMLSHLLHTQPMERSEAARRQLVSIVPNTQLSVTVVAPAVSLDTHFNNFIV